MIDGLARVLGCVCSRSSSAGTAQAVLRPLDEMHLDMLDTMLSGENRKDGARKAIDVSLGFLVSQVQTVS